MTKLYHFPGHDVFPVATKIFNFNKKDFNHENWIVIWKEKEVIDLSDVSKIGGGWMIRFNKLQELLKRD